MWKPVSVFKTLLFTSKALLSLLHSHQVLRYAPRSSQDIQNVDLIPKLNLPVLKHYSLLRRSQDIDPTQDEPFPENIAHEAFPEGPQPIGPHPDPEERQQTHPPLTGSVEPPLCIQKDLPVEERFEVLDLCADVLFHHGVESHPELVQLGFQRGQLCSLLSAQKSPRPTYSHDDSSRVGPQ